MKRKVEGLEEEPVSGNTAGDLSASDNRNGDVARHEPLAYLLVFALPMRFARSRFQD